MSVVLTGQAQSAILAYIEQCGGGYAAWYCGIASDPRDCLFNRHGVTENPGAWIFRDCGTDAAARALEQYFHSLGCKGAGRFLLIGQDVELHEPRKFYLGSTRRIRKLDARLTRFAFVDPITEQVCQWIGTIYTDRKTDQEIAKTVFQQMQHRIKQVQRFPYVVALLPWNG